MGALISLFVSLISLSLWLLTTTFRMVAGLLGLVFKAGVRGRPARRNYPRRGAVSGRGRSASGAGRFVLVAVVFLLAFAADARLGFALLAVAVVAWLVRRRSGAPRTATAQELSALFDNVRAMGGQQFEAFVAELFGAMGYRAAVLGGSGDQGVDVLLEAAEGRIAVQCKNYAKRIGNKPVQEVYAGARHHGCDHAWVVAPAGFTKGAFELASSVGVSLFDADSVRTWIAEVDRIAREREGAQATPDGGATRAGRDRQDCDALLENHRQHLRLLEDLQVQKRRHEREYRADPALGERWSETYAGIRAKVDETLAKMDVLEARNPGLATEGRAEERAALASKQLRLENTCWPPPRKAAGAWSR